MKSRHQTYLTFWAFRRSWEDNSYGICFLEVLHLIVFHWVTHLPHTCTFPHRLKNGIMLTDTPQPKSLAVSYLCSYTETEMLKRCLANKRQSPKCNRYKWTVFLSVEVIAKVISKFFQQGELFEDRAVAKFLMRPGSTSCVHDASLLQPWIYCWKSKREKPVRWTSLLQPLSSRRFANTVYKVAAYGWKRKLYS